MGKEGVQWAWVFVVALPPRFLCRNARAADDRDRRDYPARGRVETSPSGRVVHLCVILMLSQRYVHAQNFRVLLAGAVPILPLCLDPTSVTLVCGHAMCEECMGRLAVFQGQTLTRSRRRVVIQCPLRCQASTERVLA